MNPLKKERYYNEFYPRETCAKISRPGENVQEDLDDTREKVRIVNVSFYNSVEGPDRNYVVFDIRNRDKHSEKASKLKTLQEYVATTFPNLGAELLTWKNGKAPFAIEVSNFRNVRAVFERLIASDEVVKRQEESIMAGVDEMEACGCYATIMGLSREAEVLPVLQGFWDLVANGDHELKFWYTDLLVKELSGTPKQRWPELLRCVTKITLNYLPAVNLLVPLREGQRCLDMLELFATVPIDWRADIVQATALSLRYVDRSPQLITYVCSAFNELFREVDKAKFNAISTLLEETTKGEIVKWVLDLLRKTEDKVDMLQVINDLFETHADEDERLLLLMNY